MKKHVKNILIEESIKAAINSLGLILVAVLVFLMADTKLLEIQHDLQQREKQSKIQYDLSNQILDHSSLLYERSVSLSWCAEYVGELFKRNISLQTVSLELNSCHAKLEHIDQHVSKGLLLGSQAVSILDAETADLFMDLGSKAFRTGSLRKQKKIDIASTQLMDKELQGKLTLNDLFKFKMILAAKKVVMETDKEAFEENYRRLVRALIDKGYLGGSEKTTHLE